MNILSTRQLAELCSDARGQPDVTGTGIHSRFNTRVLTWNHEKHSKTFQQLDLVSPNVCSTQGTQDSRPTPLAFGKYYNDLTSLVFNSSVKQSHVLEGDIVTSKSERTIEDLKGLPLILADGSKAKDLVTFRGFEFANNREHCTVQ